MKRNWAGSVPGRRGASTLVQATRRAGFTMGASRLVVAALGLAAAPLLTRLLSPAEYGTFVLVITAVSIGSTVPSQWLNAAVLRFAPAEDPSRLHRATVTAWLRNAPVVALLTGVIAAVTLGSAWLTVAFCVAYALAESAFTTRWILLRARILPRAFIVAGVLRNGAFILVVALTGALADDVQLSWVLGGILASSLLGTASTWRALSRPQSRRADLQPWWQYGRPLILNYGLSLSMLYVDRFILQALRGKEEVALYAPTFDILYGVITLVTGLVGLVAVPRLFAQQEAHARQTHLRSLRRRAALSSAAVCVLLFAAWPALSVVMIGEDLRLGDPLTVGLLIGAFGLTAYRYQYVNIVAQLHHNTNVQTRVTALALATSVAANSVLIPSFGLRGAAASAALSASVAVLVGVWANARSPRSTRQRGEQPQLTSR